MENKKKKVLDELTASDFEKMLNEAVARNKKRNKKVLHPFINRAANLPLAEMMNAQAAPLKKSGKHRSQLVQDARRWEKNRIANRKKQGKSV